MAIERGQATDVKPAFADGRSETLDEAFYGVAEAVKRDAQAVVAMSAMTLPHALVRVLLAEQLYRAWSLMHNHPYHRE